MRLHYDRFQQPEKPKVYLGNPNNEIICALNGIDESSFSLIRNINNTFELSFDVNRFITNDELMEVQSNGYDLLNVLMRIKVDGVGWFIMSPPTQIGDGIKEVKTIQAQSAEIEFQQHDLKDFKINTGEYDSYEMLDIEYDDILNGNIEVEQIKFYDKENPKCSLLDIILDASGIKGWDIGYVDPIPKEHKDFKDGQFVSNYTSLPNEIGTFSIVSQDVYSFLTQDVAQHFGVIFVFDNERFLINAYRPDNLGDDTNININFRNIENSNEITVDENNIFTRFYVQGSDELGITFVNFGENYIENLDFFMNEKYLESSIIEKYKIWKQDSDNARTSYIEATIEYNKRQPIISELIDRVPLDDCSTDWASFTDSELLEALDNYNAQKRGLEDFYDIENDGFDDDDYQRLVESSDFDTYEQITNVIIANINIEIENRNLPTGADKIDYIDTYKTNWNLYGLDELKVCLDNYRNIKNICERNGYDVPYDDNSGHTKEYHDKMYDKYLDAIDNLDPEYEDSEGNIGCQKAYDQRQAEIDLVKAEQTEYDEERKYLRTIYQKETWVHVDDDGNEITFSSDDLRQLSKLYIDGDYQNENMFLVSDDDSVTAVNEQLKLYYDAVEQLEIASQPQYIYTTDLENFLSMYEYKDYTANLNEGDFVYLGVREDYVVKLRVMSIEYNPLTMDNSLQITFSNMLKSRSGRDDFSYLLDSSSAATKNVIAGNGTNYDTNTGVGLTPALITKLVSSSQFVNKINNIVEGNYSGALGNAGSGTISVNELNSKMISATEIVGENGFFEYLRTKLISTDSIVADNAEFKKLDALVANIDSLLAGNIAAELEHVITLTAQNVSIDEAVIKDLIAANITVAMLQAGDISADSFNIKSDDGGLAIVGNTMQFKDKDGNLRIQIGRDANEDFTFTLYDADGKGVLIDEDGIHESAISDGLIIDDMIKDGTISENKLGFKVVTANENGGIDITKVYDGTEQFGVSYTTFKTTTENSLSNINDKLDDVVAYRVEVISANGDKFRRGNISTTLECHVFYGNDDITSTIEPTKFHWVKINDDGIMDENWSALHSGIGSTVTLTSSDIWIRGTFRCYVDGITVDMD